MPFSSLAGKNKARACLIVAIVLAFLPPFLKWRCGDVAGFRNFQIKCYRRRERGTDPGD
jgi:hypothetical protein